MGHYHRSTTDHKDKWRRRQGLTAGGVALGLLWAMVATVTLTADWDVPARALPWTQLDIDDPVGLFTRGKLNRSTGAQCRMILGNGGLSYTDVPGETAGEFCSKTDAITLSGGAAPLSPRGAVMTCNEALAFALWERQIVQPAAFEHLGAGVVGIEHYGAYSCRRMYGAADTPVSQHALANALDVAAFKLSDGRRISVREDWNDPGEKGAFLHAVRDGACTVFAVTLSPDYNAEHHDHLHLDMGRGPFCR
jgi:hypothetical protein